MRISNWAIVLAAALGGCAAGSMRQPAATLAQGGVAATSALALDQQALASQLRGLDAIEAFSRTYEACASQFLCKPQPSAKAASEEREGLAQAILLRARAADALGEAYRALETEASYDARADAQSAAGAAIGAVNSYASAVSGIPVPGGAPLIGETAQKLAAYGAGLLAAGAQDRRIIRDSHAIAAATLKFRDALQGEARVFDTLTAYVGLLQSQATGDLLESGLTPPDAGLKPLLGDLGLEASRNAESLVNGSPRLKTALVASVTARQQTNVARTQRAYRAAIGALDALLEAHHDLEQKRTPALAALNARVAELNALLGKPEEKDK